MKAVQGIIVELENKKLSYNGVEMDYNFITKTATTAIFKEGIELSSDYSSPLFCPDRGIVIDSDDPKIQVGDLVILDYFAVIKKLGTSIEQHQKDPHDIFEMVNGKVHIPIKTHKSFGEQYVYAIFRNGEFVQYNDFEIVEVVREKEKSKVYTMHLDRHTGKLTEDKATDKCNVLFGEYAGMTCLFNPSYLLGEAQKSVIDGKQVYFIQSEFILAEVEV